MIILNATNKSITVLTDATASTTELDITASYVDITTTTCVPASQDAITTGTTPVTAVSSPDSNTQRKVMYLSINNKDTVAHLTTVRYLNNATNRVLISVVLGVNDTLNYVDKRGFFVTDSSGAEKPAVQALSSSQFLMSVSDAANLTAVSITVSNSSYAVWLGTAGKVSSSVTVRLRVTTAAATITWAECGIFKGNVNIGGNPTLTRLGTANVAGTYNSTGIISTTVTLSTPTAIGDDLWCVFGAQATTALRVRGSLADDIQSGTYANLTSTRPSTVASPTAWTLGNATDPIPWIKAYIN